MSSVLLDPVITDRLILSDFADALADRAATIEGDIAHLKRAPGDLSVLGALFRNFHSLKGDAGMCGFEIVVLLAHGIEALLTRLRDGNLRFGERLSETLLLTLDRIELATEVVRQQRKLDHLRLLELLQGLERLAIQAPDAMEGQCALLIEQVTGFSPAVFAPPSTHVLSEPEGDIYHNAQLAADLQFFRTLALQFESRNEIFKGRTARILRLGLETNKLLGYPVNPVQLEAAIYLHDVGMMFLPESVWLKMGSMTDADKLALRSHPGLASGILERMPGWGEAAQMVAQHHEMADGNGYPAGLKGNAICPGAQLIAVIDAFEAVMFKHIHRGKNRSVLRAVAEINACNKQFAPEWITPFNSVIRFALGLET
jgi:HD-GYP domain-containing protein (c-di-GMP phosphodiesterase class II)